MTSVWPISGLEIPESIPGATSLFWILSAITSENEALITNISVIQTWRWFFALTPFESVFLGMIMMQIFTLQMLQILPINLNQFLHGAASGRKKRGVVAVSQCKEISNHYLGGNILNILQKVDNHGCILRTVCEMQKHSHFQVEIPESILLTLTVMSTSSKCSTHRSSDTPFKDEPTFTQKLLQLYQEAINIGDKASYSMNSTNCEQQYHECPLNFDEILTYVHQMQLDDMV